MARLAAAALCLCLAAPAGAVTIEQIPDPRPSGWTVDLTGSLTPATVQALNRLGDDVKARTGGEMMVVVVGTIDGADPHDFATRLGNAWGIGDRDADNGLLLFAALDDRAAEIALGNGLYRPETRQASDEIMQGEMVPRFREGDASGALLHGARAAASRIFHAAPPAEAPAAAIQPPAPAPQTLKPASRPPARGSGLLWLLLTGLASIAIGLAFLKHASPSCRDCRARMVKLSEDGDDLHLEPAEQIEEQVGSVNYDIWMCNGCGQIKKRRWPFFFSGFGICPGCNARTKSQVSTTLRHADEYSEGLVQVTESCCNCDYRTTYNRVVPRHTRSSGSSGSGFSSSSSSGGGSRSGGGSFSGGGSSGRW
jgi:uncharacterized protein